MNTLLGLSSHGGDDGIRTHDPLLAGQVLSQLSYTPIINAFTQIIEFCFFSLPKNEQWFFHSSLFTANSVRSGRPKWTRTTLITYLSLHSRKAAFALLRVRFFYLFLLVGPSGLEPPTSCLSGTRSNLLSYEPMWLVWLFLHHLVFWLKGKQIALLSSVNVSTELSSHTVSRRVFSPLQSLTSVFGMGTGGPSAFVALTFFFSGIAPWKLNNIIFLRSSSFGLSIFGYAM